MEARVIKYVTTPEPHQGFLGEGHVAKAVIDGRDFSRTDPFILLMDDQLNLPGGKPVGGPHPHAGFETVTLVLKGDGKDWHTGSMELMTAGKGIIHTEEIETKTEMHILQMWLVLPPEQRWAQPFWQQVLLEDVPTLKTNEAEIRVYSGSSNGLDASFKNHTPFTLVDFNIVPNSEVKQEVPVDYNGFIYVLEGEVWSGATRIAQGQSGWLNAADKHNSKEVIFKAGNAESRFILYAAAPHNAKVVSYGPFIGDTNKDIIRLYQEYQMHQMPHLSELPESSKIRHHKAAVQD